ncbi:FGGY-family carbohydrate kinase [Jiella marina]|uniref:FGGY-family carbohydrate kinase n=1 Tax=Jiella sp. LLJ827 TaxID=2917712 RepID=UPI0021017AA7|nr:FGGY-family carbohydrate kinase [Jiella sp. LLJ827]MCQ0987890.1 carbohydrate kinase [Jiella sp. LLJ827]
MAAGTVLIGIDAGTSVIKSVAFDLEGRQIAVASRPNSYEALSNGGVVQDMARTFTDTAATLKELVGKLPGGAASVAAVAVTAQGDGTWLFDREGEPVTPAWLWLDARAGELASAMLKREGYRQQYERTGTGVNACQQSVHLLHMRQNTPEWLERAATACHCKDWLYFKLTGTRATDPTEATFTFGDFRSRDYAEDVIEGFGLTDQRHLMPPIVDGRKESHPLSEAAAQATGLLAGTPVILGYVDVVCTAVGGGLISREGAAGCSVLGSTGMHMRHVRSSDDVVLNEDGSGYVMLLPSERAVAQMQSNMAATLNIDWMLDLAAGILRYEGVERGRQDLVTGLDDRVLEGMPLSALYHPYISEAGERGPFMDPNARANFTGLHANAGFADMMRSVLEGLAFAARDCYSATGALPSEIRLTGGAARSKAMRSILASVLDRPVRTVDIAEAGAAGAVMIALVQQGHHPDIEAAAEAWVTPRLSDPTPPDSELAPHYDAAFELYRDLRKALPTAWKRLSTIKRGMQTG